MADNKQRFVWHDESINSYGIVVLTSGADFTRFETNPVMLFMHRYDCLLGRWEDWKVEGTTITGSPVFNSENQFAKERQQEVEAGFLKGCSIGIDILEMDVIDSVLIVTKWQLTEVSLVSIPSNANALRMMYKGEEITEEKALQLKMSYQTQNSEMKNRAQIITALNLSATASDEDIQAAIEKLSADNKAKSDSINALQDDKIELMLTAAVAAGKFPDTDKPKWLKLAKIDFPGTKEVIDSLPGKEGNTETPAATGTPAQPLKLIKEPAVQGVANADDRTNWTYDDYATKDSKALQLMKKNEREKFDALLAAKKDAVKTKVG